MKHLKAEDVLAMHDYIIRQTSGLHGLRDLGLLEAAVERPRAQFDGKDLYKAVFDKAAALLESLAMNHVFVDGNKRTAMSATARFLFLNDHQMTCSNEKFVTFILHVVVDKPELLEIAHWFKKNTKRI